MNETKYGMAMSRPQEFGGLFDSTSHSLPLMHDSIICCHPSPVAHLQNKGDNKNKRSYRNSMHQLHIIKPLHTPNIILRQTCNIQLQLINWQEGNDFRTHKCC